ncbi:MAG TPA: YciI family protein [Phenylobacterium sp.]|nr:YciI family protein [Phenylobacterium sp.]
MRVMVIVKANPESEAGALPNPELIEKMGAYNNELIAAGVMLDAGGLQSSAKGARVSIRRGQAVVTDGPFAETKELIGGYWVWQVKSMQDAIDWARKAPSDGDKEFNLEIRPFFEPEDFAEVASPELIAQERGWREEQASKAPKASA